MYQTASQTSGRITCTSPEVGVYPLYWHQDDHAGYGLQSKVDCVPMTLQTTETKTTPVRPSVMGGTFSSDSVWDFEAEDAHPHAKEGSNPAWFTHEVSWTWDGFVPYLPPYIANVSIAIKVGGNEFDDVNDFTIDVASWAGQVITSGILWLSARGLNAGVRSCLLSFSALIISKARPKIRLRYKGSLQGHAGWETGVFLDTDFSITSVITRVYLRAVPPEEAQEGEVGIPLPRCPVRPALIHFRPQTTCVQPSGWELLPTGSI